MIGFGFNNSFPFTFGGGESYEETELQALLDAYAPGWDASEDTANYAECQAWAQCIAMIWHANDRLRNEAIASRMLTNVPDWERILRLRPGPRDTDVERRALVASRLRGLAENTITAIRDACETLLGDYFVDLVFAAPADIVAYIPGLNPGPPGFEWSTNRMVLGIKLATGQSTADYADRVAALSSVIDSMLPSWMTYSIGTGSGFVVGVGIVGQTFI